MTRSRVVMLSLFSFAALTAGTVTAQASGGSTAEPQTIFLHAYHKDTTGYAGPVRTKGILPVGSLYVAEVSGTVSYYAKTQYVHPSGPWDTVCGAPTHSLVAGDVGVDAEFVFGRPWTSPCPRKLPVHWHNFEISTDGGLTYSHPKPLKGPFTAPTPEHKYSYPLIGGSKKAVFRLLDDPEGKPSTADNYGKFTIYVRPAVASDCAGTGYLSFGKPTEAACVAAV